MGQIIASTYELLREIGSGGGGVVYLGQHLRLNKLVVLKADKRTLTAKPEALRREVDALKSLSHTYIPQVYDFVQEDGVVYTVMDYIDGESLDKPLKRGTHFPQAQVVEWACQLLEALVYLHSRPPHGILHSDIKPSNIMLTPQGDIRLIDFNIALALGEKGAVRVGYSQGYASPEHYGLDYSTGSVKTGSAAETELMTDTGATLPLASNSPSAPPGSRPVMLDVRSDIYSLGATLYHLFTGVRPPMDAKIVQPIAASNISPSIAAIIRKAMDPNPDLRYQSAAEMLWDFEHLHENDPRTKKLQNRKKLSLSIAVLLFLAAGVLAFAGSQTMRQDEERSRLALEQINGSKAALAEGDNVKASALAVDALSLQSPYQAMAQKALTDALGVYDLSDGWKPLRTVELTSMPQKMGLSPDGRLLYAINDFTLSVFDTEKGTLLGSLPVIRSALADAVFLDNGTIAYAGEEGLTVYDISGHQTLWTGEKATSIAASEDGQYLASIYRDEDRCFVYERGHGEPVCEFSFHGKHQSVVANDIYEDPGDDLLAIREDGQVIAVSFSDGSLMLYQIKDPEDEIEVLGPSDYRVFSGGFHGNEFAFSAFHAGQGSESLFSVVDTEQLVYLGQFAMTTPFTVQADRSDILLSNDNVLISLDPSTGDQKEIAYTQSNIEGFSSHGAYTVVVTDDQQAALYGNGAVLLSQIQTEENIDFADISEEYVLLGSLNTPSIRLLKIPQDPEHTVFSYDPAWEHQELRVCKEYGTAMLYQYDSLRVCDMSGNLICEIRIPDADSVFDQQFRRDPENCRLEVTFQDGRICAYSAKDGTLIEERQGDQPDLTLYEEFYTDEYRIETSLHETPVVYEKDGNRKICELEPDAELVYVTQSGPYIITEYLSMDGQRYGLILNGDCETLAELPYLCDIDGDVLYFDYPAGVVRQTRIYSIDELIALQKEEQSND